ncbi:MAG: ATP-binding protein [Acidobacteriota bacterium]
MALSVIGVGVVTVFYAQMVAANPTTVALSYLVLVLLIATRWGIVEATVASILSTLTFNLAFLPPIGTLTIADPENWISFIAFMATAIVVSQLSGRLRQRHLEALARQGDLERLYALSRALLLSDSGASLSSHIARQIADVFDLPTVALYDHQYDTISWAGSWAGGTTERQDLETRLRDSARQAVSFHDLPGVVVTAIRLGRAPIGSLALGGRPLSDTVLQSVANLAAIGLERARGQDAVAAGEAARQSGELRAVVLDAVAHDFKTPLTSSKAAASALLSSATMAAEERELVVIILEELDRLQALVSDAVQMLRIDSGDFVLHRDHYLLADIARVAVAALAPRLDGHTLSNRVPPELVVDADRDLLALALRQLLDNALKYAAPGTPIDIDASGTTTVAISVRNVGPVIPAREQARLFERFYRGTLGRRIAGTGMGLAIVQQVAHAHGGTLTVASAPVSGTVFTLSLPEATVTA